MKSELKATKERKFGLHVKMATNEEISESFWIARRFRPLSTVVLSRMHFTESPERNGGRAWQKGYLQGKGHENPKEHARKE
jgi:hypothetical protein